MLNRNFDFSFRQPIECNDRFVEFLSQSFMLSAVLFSAVDFELFDAIDSGAGRLDELANRTGLSPAQLKKLLDACVSLGLLNFGDCTYSNSDSAARLLTKASATNILPVVTHYSKHIYGLFGLLPKAIEQGRNQVDSWSFLAEHSGVEDADMYSELSSTPEEYHRFIRAMNHFSLGVGDQISRDLDFSSINSMVDLGCGGGRVSAELAQAIPHLEVFLVDKEQVLEVAHEEACNAGIQDRVTLIPGDILGDTNLQEKKYDAVLVSAVLGDWDRKNQLKILNSAMNALKPGGRLIVSETLAAEEGGPLLPALLSLYVLVLTQGGENFTYSSLSSLLEEAGFQEIKLLDHKDSGLRDTVLAVSPSST